jgi:trimethylamine--corrinoid protein Co-methyltransferase
MKLKPIEVLSNQEIQDIHSASMELLETVGISIDDKNVQALFLKNGAEINKASGFIRIPESMIKNQLKNVPKAFKLHGPDGSYSFEVNTESTHFSTIGTPVKIYDPSNKTGVRETKLEDTIKAIRLVDGLEHIVSIQDDVHPTDVSNNTLQAHLVIEWAKNSNKSYGFGAYGRVVSQDIMNLVSLVVGGEEELIKRPRLIGFFNPSSPLRLTHIMTNGLEVFTKYKQPIIIASEALAGSLAPVTLAGLLTQTNAEIIGGIVLSQLYNPGAPIFYGNISHVADVRSGNSAMGSIETGLITIGVAQLARFYDIPSRGLGAVTDSKTLDIQNGIERLQTLMFAAQAGINFITCAGSYEATLAEALELLVIDNELIGMVKRALEGISVNEDALALDVIKEVATKIDKGTYFLSKKHTIKHMRKELFVSKLMDRDRRDTWTQKGSKNLVIRAGEKVEEILRTQKGPGLSLDTETELKKYMKQMAERSDEECKKAEGIIK